MIEQSWLRDGIFSGSRIEIFYSGLDRKIRKSRYPGNWDQHLKSRKKNPDNPKIPGIVIGILKPLKNPGKIPSAKSRKSRNPGDRDRDFKTSKKSRKSRNPGDQDWELKIPKKSRVKILGIRDFP